MNVWIDPLLGRSKSLSRPGKVMIQIIADAILIIASFLFSMALRLEGASFSNDPKIWQVVLLSEIAAIATLWFSGLYRSLVRFVTGKIIRAIGRAAIVLVLSMLVLNFFLMAGIPRSVPVMTGAFSLLAIAGLRFQVRYIFKRAEQFLKRPVAVYGAGQAGLELINSLFHGSDYDPVALIDDNPELQGLVIGGCHVYPPSALSRLKANFSLDAVFLAMPNLAPSSRREILLELEKFNLEVKSVPSLSEILTGKAKKSALRNITPDELLGRDAVPPNIELCGRSIKAKAVMVTGAGGSIGGELSRQILGQGPNVLVLYEVSEIALYSIVNELIEMKNKSGIVTEIVPILGSVQDEARLDAVIKAFKVKTIFHAAAYKHVPIVEENIIEGVRNNVFGTFAVAKVALSNQIERFILISTDKAVRPANVMGATKRLAELICQGLAQQQRNTIFSMVRFGNVLGSSGSVIPRFSAQIKAGGPITVTHPEINRYFMTIPEAAQLVIQASAMAKGGDVFILDMGKPVKILDLAISMIRLHGLRPCVSNHPAEQKHQDCDVDQDYGIAIEFTGLRKGEKLYEELLIGNNPEPTEHPRIMTASEGFMPFEELSERLASLRSACDELSAKRVFLILKELPLDFHPKEDEIEDLLWRSRQILEPRK